MAEPYVCLKEQANPFVGYMSDDEDDDTTPDNCKTVKCFLNSFINPPQRPEIMAFIKDTAIRVNRIKMDLFPFETELCPISQTRHLGLCCYQCRE